MTRIIPLVLLGACATDPTLDDVVQETVATAPTPRGYSAMVYDSQSEQYVVLGGLRPGFGPTPDVWAGTAAGTAWRQLGRLPAGPTVVAAYHEALDRTVVWMPTRARPDGGGNLEPYLRADAISETWTFDLDTNTWEQIATAGPTPGLMGARMSYDAQSQRLILFGGYDYRAGGFVDDTWALDLATHEWTNMNPATRPTGRNFHGQTYHAGIDRVVVVAGMDVSFELTNHVWTYDVDGNAWTQLHAPDAPARDYVSLASIDGHLVLHGGLDADGVAQRDTWESDLASWQRVHDGTDMTGRAYHTIAAGENKLLMFGGGPALDTLTDHVWEYRPSQLRWKQR